MNLIVYGIYRPHQGTIQSFSGIVDDLLSSSSSNTSVILGDLNVNLLLPDQSTDFFINVMHAHHFLPLITKPTRFPSDQHGRPSLLDHIWFSEASSIKSGIIMLDLTDHLPVYANLPLVRNQPDKSYTGFRAGFRLFDLNSDLIFSINF